MYLKLKNWLGSLEWLFNNNSDLSAQKQVFISQDYSNLAFKLACADEISDTLPDILSTVETQLNSTLAEQNQLSILVLFSNPTTSESIVHHGQSVSLPHNLTNTLHHHFTIKKPADTEVLELTINNEVVKLVPVRLFDHEQHTIWLLYLFDQQLANVKQLKWKTVSLQDSLSRGIKAWCQTQSKIRIAVQSERSSYAAELHDSLAQILGYLKLKSAKLDKLCQRPPHQELKSITEDLATYTHCAYHQTRELIVSSRLTLQSDNLSEAVTNSIKEFEHQSAIVFDLDNRLASENISSKQAMQIIYIIRESLSNIVRHSHATHARIILYIENMETLHVQIEDNGHGIDPAAARTDSFGLQIMHERAERIGAEFQITQRQPCGTRVELTLNIGNKR